MEFKFSQSPLGLDNGFNVKLSIFNPKNQQRNDNQSLDFDNMYLTVFLKTAVYLFSLVAEKVKSRTISLRIAKLCFTSDKLRITFLRFSLDII